MSANSSRGLSRSPCRQRGSREYDPTAQPFVPVTPHQGHAQRYSAPSGYHNSMSAPLHPHAHFPAPGNYASSFHPFNGYHHLQAGGGAFLPGYTAFVPLNAYQPFNQAFPTASMPTPTPRIQTLQQDYRQLHEADPRRQREMLGHISAPMGSGTFQRTFTTHNETYGPRLQTSRGMPPATTGFTVINQASQGPGTGGEASGFKTPNLVQREASSSHATATSPSDQDSPQSPQDGKRKMGGKRVARNPARPRKVKGKQDFDAMTEHMTDENSTNLIGLRSGVQPHGAPLYQDNFRDKQAAIEHLLRTGTPIEYWCLPQRLLIKEADLPATARLTLQQLTLEAASEAPRADLVPAFAVSAKDKQSFIDKNKYQYDIVRKQLGDALDSSACVCILIATIFDLHDEARGIPLNDLDLSAQSQSDIDAKTLVSANLTTKKGKYPLELDLTLLQRTTLIIDIVKKFKWVAKDVLQNTNILDLVVAPRHYLATKLHNVNTAKTRQERWDEDQVRRGTKKPKKNGNTQPEAGGNLPSPTPQAP
ncbi:hypothetical protein CKM354_000484300 [Cercospora kikuchii]|uniref:Uncharacterized protein n=1 Tax=Cercospora kikuchii TaxID=84275 RepID=A0A9P3CHL4_9PEZI|nr:uncharacterized protein CKM354_000484300 [Cercospora kikuchii]GIZ41542.1 hypothetical protein CKM354_000484300 [Cercospora kikuchii]